MRMTTMVMIVGMCLAPAYAADDGRTPVTIGLIGDSTVATTYGWGPAFAERCGERTTVVNYAKNGATLESLSTKLDALLERKPDYVLIQFGHNDMKRYGADEYGKKLRDYVERVKRSGSRPVVLSSVTRRNFGADGKIEPRVIEGRTLPEFAKTAKAVAKDAGAPFVDLNTITIAHHNRIGPEATAAYDFEPTDKTHFSPAGAKATVDLIVPALTKAVPELASIFR